MKMLENPSYPHLSGTLPAGDGEKIDLEMLTGQPEKKHGKMTKIFNKAKRAKKKIKKFIDANILTEERLIDLTYIVYCGFVIGIIILI